MKNALLGKAETTRQQLLRYTVVGGLAFVVDFGSLFLLTEYAGLHYLLAAALAFMLGLTTNYLLSITWVFNERSLRSPAAEFLVFALLGVVGLGLNELLLFTLTGLFGLHYLGSKVIATGVTFAWNFLSRKFTLFTRPTPTAQPAESGDALVPNCV